MGRWKEVRGVEAGWRGGSGDVGRRVIANELSWNCAVLVAQGKATCEIK